MHTLLRPRSRDSLTGYLQPKRSYFAFADRLVEIEDYFDVNDSVKMRTALDDVVAYMDECERVGVSMHPADVRSLIATALGVTA